MKELVRPWKFVTFAIGMSILYWGARNLDCPDWDIGNSTLMGLWTYLLAPPCARILVQRKWLWMPLIPFAWWFCVDGLYVAYNGLAHMPIYREANFYASSYLFWLCAFIWLPKASIKEVLLSPRSALTLHA